MIRKWLVASALCILAGSTLQVSSAQFDDGNLRARAGIFIPSEGGLQNYKKVWFAVGLAYELEGLPLLGSSGSEISVDLFAHHTGGSRGTIVPIVFSQKYAQAMTSGVEVNFSVGVGMWIVDAQGPSSNVLGGRVGLNVLLGGGFSVDAHYDFTDRKSGNPRANGVSLMLGYQF
ncbi:MAG: hypothetical protein KIT45_03035 [Fimbriimonadia bacterium]|nr:hypothetical protein [Fimbriimonadia bacterium]